MGNDDLVSKPQEGQRITATDVLISEGRRYEDDDRWGAPGSDMRIMAALIQRLTARLEEATKAERLAGTLAVTLRVNAYRAGWKTEDVDAAIAQARRDAGYDATAREAMAALDGEEG